MSDKYFVEMSNYIKKELRNQNLYDVLDQNQIVFFANYDMFVIDAYNIIKKIKQYTIKFNKNKLNFDELKKIIDEYLNS